MRKRPVWGASPGAEPVSAPPRNGYRQFLAPGDTINDQIPRGASCVRIASRPVRSPSMSTLVTTRAGKLEGEQLSNQIVFRGIPFAAPPVGDRTV